MFFVETIRSQKINNFDRFKCENLSAVQKFFLKDY